MLVSFLMSSTRVHTSSLMEPSSWKSSNPFVQVYSLVRAALSQVLTLLIWNLNVWTEPVETSSFICFIDPLISSTASLRFSKQSFRAEVVELWGPPPHVQQLLVYICTHVHMFTCVQFTCVQRLVVYMLHMYTMVLVVEFLL